MKVCVLSGGNVKGGYQAGALLKLEENGISFDHIYGVSVGAVNAVGWSYGNAKRLVEIWKGLRKSSDIIKLEWWSSLKRFFPTYNMNPLEKRLKEYAGGALPKCPATVSYVNLMNGKLLYACNSGMGIRDFIYYVIASASEPPLVKALDGTYLDGGIRDQTPLKKAIDDGATEIMAILTNPVSESMEEWEPGFPRSLSELVRTIDIVLNEAFISDIRRCLAYNQIPGKVKVKLNYIYPSENFPGSFKVVPEEIERAIELGYKDADKLLNV